ncbi:MAG TPA: hypothetical protein VHO90_21035 [Bacteroidales bacterium]|nr:hypothetical protein [Bacteroidales bacterium]
MVRKLLIGFAFIFFLANSLNAQNYNTGLGGRIGFFNGFTVKHFVQSDRALEGLLSFRWNGFVITGLYEYQKPLKGVNNLDWYIGVGGHVGFWDGDDYYWHHNNDNHSIVGIDFIGGLEYTFEEVPINIGLDWKPAFNFIGDDHVWIDGLALSIRYAIK